MEHCVFASFTIEIIFKCMRLPPNADESEYKHILIIKRYMKTGEFFFDFVATFPFYLIPQENSDTDYATLLKLLRMVRIPKILNLLDLTRFNKFTDALVSGQTRGKKVQYQQAMKNIFKVIRLILLTVIITYFTGCTFYFVSSLQPQDEQNFLINNSLADD